MQVKLRKKDQEAIIEKIGERIARLRTTPGRARARMRLKEADDLEKQVQIYSDGARGYLPTAWISYYLKEE